MRKSRREVSAIFFGTAANFQQLLYVKEAEGGACTSGARRVLPPYAR